MLFNQDKLLGLCNTVNEVRCGLPKASPVDELLAAGSVVNHLDEQLQAASSQGVEPADVSMTPADAASLLKAIDIVLGEIKDPELHARLGIGRSAFYALRSRLEQP